MEFLPVVLYRASSHTGTWPGASRRERDEAVKEPMPWAFAYRALRRGLADVLGTAGQCPLTGVAAALEQDGAAVVDDQEVAGGDEGVGLGGGAGSL